MSEKYLFKYDEDIKVDAAVFNEVNRQRTKMESIIKKLEIRLRFNKPVVKYVYMPHRVRIVLCKEKKIIKHNFDVIETLLIFRQCNNYFLSITIW